MDATQIGLGSGLLVVGALTLAGPATFVSGPVAYLLTAAIFLVSVYALFLGLWRGRRPKSTRP